jgi:serine palmitoyltransferase
MREVLALMASLQYLTMLTTLFSYGVLLAFGRLRDFFRGILDAAKSGNLKVCSAVFLLASSQEYMEGGLLLTLLIQQGYAPICLGYEDFYRRRIYLRIQVRDRRLFIPRFLYVIFTVMLICGPIIVGLFRPTYC